MSDNSIDKKLFDKFLKLIELKAIDSEMNDVLKIFNDNSNCDSMKLFRICVENNFLFPNNNFVSKRV